MTSWTRLFFIYCQLFGIYIVFDDFNKTFTSKIQPLKETPFFFMLLSKSDESSLSNNVIVYWITHPPLGYVIQKRMSITYFPKKLVQCASSSTLRVCTETKQFNIKFYLALYSRIIIICLNCIVNRH